MDFTKTMDGIDREISKAYEDIRGECSTHGELREEIGRVYKALMYEHGSRSGTVVEAIRAGLLKLHEKEVGGLPLGRPQG